MEFKSIATNKKAYRDYFFLEKWECGIVLNGGEVKSLREGSVSFTDSFARIDDDEIWLHSLHIAPYAQASYLNEDPDRKRKLLLHKKEIQKISGLVAQKSLTLIPTRIYFNNRGIAKVELALAKGKKFYDKREDMKKKEQQREVSRALRHRQR